MEDTPSEAAGHRTAASKPLLVIVSGRPGAGKSTLSRTLATELACPLVARDDINEGIRHTFRHDPRSATKDHVARAAFDTFFRTIELLIHAQVTLVAEAAFQDPLWQVGLARITPFADARIINCVIEADQAAQRIAQRRTERSRPRRPGAPPNTRRIDTGTPAARAFLPISIPVPSLQVNTMDGYTPGLDDIIAFALADATPH